MDEEAVARKGMLMAASVGEVQVSVRLGPGKAWRIIAATADGPRESKDVAAGAAKGPVVRWAVAALAAGMEVVRISTVAVVVAADSAGPDLDRLGRGAAR